VKYFAIYFLILNVMGLASIGKLQGLLSGAGAPEFLTQTFGGTVISTFPGVTGAWWIIALVEGLVAILAIISIIRLEFMPERRKSWLILALSVSLVTFAMLAFGQNLVENHESVASLYTYFGATVIMILMVRTDWKDWAVNKLDTP
jgi:Ca2+/Na+ antiporter